MVVTSEKETTRVDDDSGVFLIDDAAAAQAAPAIKMEYVNHYDVALNDAVVPVVPECPSVHDDFAPIVSEGRLPEPTAMVRGPTTADWNLLAPRIRDKPVSA